MIRKYLLRGRATESVLTADEQHVLHFVTKSLQMKGLPHPEVAAEVIGFARFWREGRTDGKLDGTAEHDCYGFIATGAYEQHKSDCE